MGYSENDGKIVTRSLNSMLPILSPQGDKVAILDYPPRDQEKFKLIIMNLHDSPREIATISDEFQHRRFAWSPDGKFIAIGSKKDGQFLINFIDANSGETKNSLVIDDEPDNFVWSPDGKMIMYETRQPSSSGAVDTDLWYLDIINSSKSILHAGDLDGNFFNYHAVWSPDSKYVAFFKYSNNNNLRLTVKDIGSLAEKDYDIPCSSVQSADWISSP
jgi:Tol biopolymer transport system component